MDKALHIAAFVVIGVLLGAGYFAVLRIEVRRIVGGLPARYAILIHVARLAAAGLAFWVVAQFGAAALLAALAGFTLALATLKPLSTS
jgi:hypothetical protein